MKATEQYFPVVLFIMLYKVVLTFESVYEILKCDHSNESYWVVLSCGAVYYAVQDGSTFYAYGGNPKVQVVSCGRMSLSISLRINILSGFWTWHFKNDNSLLANQGMEGYEPLIS